MYSSNWVQRSRAAIMTIFDSNIRLNPDERRAVSRHVLSVLKAESSQHSRAIRAGLRLARATGQRLGRPRVEVDVRAVARLRAAGASWRLIAGNLGLGLGTVHRLARVGDESGLNFYGHVPTTSEKEHYQWLRKLRMEHRTLVRQLRRGKVPSLTRLQSFTNRLNQGPTRTSDGQTY